MKPLSEFLPLLARDFLFAAALGGIISGLWKGEPFGFSFAIGCLWLGLNTVLLGLLIAALSPGRRGGGVWLLLLACAKIPLAYFLLLWLLPREFIVPAGIIAALAALPIVMVWRGLAGRRGSAA